MTAGPDAFRSVDITRRDTRVRWFGIQRARQSYSKRSTPFR